MNHNSEYQLPHEDELSLIDMATIFVRQRRVFYAVVFFVTFLGVGYTFFIPEKYEFISLIEVAKGVDRAPLEDPKNTIATLANQWLPEYQARFREEENSRLPLNLEFRNPENTGLIRFESEASPEVAEIVKQAHQALIKLVVERQQSIISKAELSLQSQIDSLEKTIEALKTSPEGGEALVEAIRQKGDLESKLQQLGIPEVLVMSRQGIDRVGYSKKVVILTSLIVGLLVGILATFLAEFITIVRKQLLSEQRKYDSK